jgi:hypothetical protein
MPTTQAPHSIAELWYLIDKRLSAIELAQAQHASTHADLKSVLEDHESRLRSAHTVSGLFGGAGGLLATIALIKSFLR